MNQQEFDDDKSTPNQEVVILAFLSAKWYLDKRQYKLFL